ncbi:carbonic anhydrase [Lipomyces oligophaga]|uniref:carbonic anhydrase n=1 Tax=Lipomyces oligophaga TaxID=45792 RepID=UPI0034CDE108
MIQDLLASNQAWAQRTATLNPALFARNAKGQNPHVLWIGCSDSRVGESCLDLLPGSVFVHRNIANLMPYGDLSSLSVVQFAVDVLKVKHIVVCGHYDCGGAAAALGNKSLGILDHWLKHLRDVRAKHKDELGAIADPKARLNRLVELNVITQVHHVCRMAPVAAAMKQGRLVVSGLIYDVSSGRIKPMEIPADTSEEDYDLYDAESEFEH